MLVPSNAKLDIEVLKQSAEPVVRLDV